MEIIIGVKSKIWDALRDGKLRFFSIANSHFAQSGDYVTFRKLEEDGTYVRDNTKPLYANFDIKLRLGFFVPGGQLGIELGYSCFQLESSQ